MARSRSWWISFLALVLLVGCRSERHDDHPTMDFDPILQIDALESYLVDHVGISGFGGEVFCAYEPFDTLQGVGGKAYLWVLCQEYYLEQEALNRGSGVSLPVVLRIQEIDGRYEILDSSFPRDGAYYGSDVRAAFPECTWAHIMPRSVEEIHQYNDRANKLESETEMKARAYYGF
jgi:hypothetical protein